MLIILLLVYSFVSFSSFLTLYIHKRLYRILRFIGSILMLLYLLLFSLAILCTQCPAQVLGAPCPVAVYGQLLGYEALFHIDSISATFKGPAILEILQPAQWKPLLLQHIITCKTSVVATNRLHSTILASCATTVQSHRTRSFTASCCGQTNFL